MAYVAFLLLCEAKLWRPGVVFGAAHNNQIVEAQSWWSGRLDLPERYHDTAVAEGRVYSHFPLLFTILSAACVPFWNGVPHWLIVFIVLVGIPLPAYVLFLKLTGSPWWGAVGSIGLVCGTSAWPVIDRAIRGGSPYFVNHTLALIGLLLFLNAYFGRRRVWAAGAGLIVATLARQLTAAMAIPLAWLTAVGSSQAPVWRRWVWLALTGIVVVGVPLTANALKFGSPFDTGYMRIYEGKDTPFARDAREYGLFSAHFVPRNFYYMNLGFPRVHVVETAGQREYHLRPNFKGTGIWWTTPLLIWLFVDIRRILRDPSRGWLLAGAGLVYVALLFFHATGADQRGYNRFSLDYLPVLLAIVAPGCFVGARRWVSLAMVAWSVIYFRWLI